MEEYRKRVDAARGEMRAKLESMARQAVGFKIQTQHKSQEEVRKRQEKT